MPSVSWNEVNQATTVYAEKSIPATMVTTLYLLGPWMPFPIVTGADGYVKCAVSPVAYAERTSLARSWVEGTL